MNSDLNNDQMTANDPSNVANKPRKKNMTEAALAANRANAQESTGPRTAAGKARSASNAFQHGLYSIKNYQHLVCTQTSSPPPSTTCSKNTSL